MKSVKYFCDKCGREVDYNDIQSFNIYWRWSWYMNFKGDQIFYEYLCVDCAEKLYNKISEYFRELRAEHGEES